MSKKWIPMFAAMPPLRSSDPFQESFPGDVVPATARRHVGQSDLVFPRAGFTLESLLQRNEHRMDAELKNGPDAAACFAFQFRERVQVPWVDHKRLLAESIGSHSQRQPYVCVVEKIRWAYRDVVNPVRLRPTTLLFEETIEALNFAKEAHVKRVAIENAYGITWVGGRNETVPSLADRRQMAWRHKPCYSDDRKVFQRTTPWAGFYSSRQGE
jgi:hypothetical protein